LRSAVRAAWSLEDLGIEAKVEGWDVKSASAPPLKKIFHLYRVLNTAKSPPYQFLLETRQLTTPTFKMASTIQTLDGGRAWYSPPTGPMTLGEAPIYRSSDSTLHWVDCLSSPPELHILHIDPVSGSPLGTARVLILDESVSAAYFREAKKGSYICAYYAGIAYLDEDTGKLEVLKEIIPAGEREERRFNDGGVDAKGRFWAAEIDKLVCSCLLLCTLWRPA
jgi:hypothetical protein